MEVDQLPRILVAEDNEDHAYLLRLAFESGDAKSELVFVEDGVEAMDYLESCDSVESLPGLILLDINMPRMDGFEVLEKVKSSRTFSHIPVVILTSSAREEDIARVYEKGGCSFVSKPVKFDEFRDVIASFYVYWTQVAKIPKKGTRS